MDIVKPENTSAFTVVSPNYLAHAFSLRKSFLENNPGSHFFIAVIGSKRHLPEKNDCNCIFLDELNDTRVKEMTQRYNSFELSCALKPFFATHIFNSHSKINRLIYLDGDMYVFGPFRQLSNAAITISPHRTVHVNYLPGLDNFSTTALLKYGVYNAGYFELLRKNETFRFLCWWQALTENHAYNKPGEHFFTDQLWLTAIHSFFDDVYVNKNPGYNVAFWNLIERKVTENNGLYFVNGEPLVLFHFSNYKIEEADKLVNFEHPMLSFTAMPVLKPVFEKYTTGLQEAGYEKIKLIPYPYFYQRPEKKKGFWKKMFLFFNRHYQ